MQIRALTFALLIASFVGAAQAAPVTFHIAGTYDSATDSLTNLNGKSFTYDIAYDTLTTAAFGGESGDDYGIFSLTSFSATVDGQKYDLLDPTGFLSSSSYGKVASFTGSTNGQAQAGYLFNLDFEPSSAIDVTTLPTSLVTLANDSSVTATMRDISEGGEFFTYGSASASNVSVQVQATPEPATMLGLGMGALGLLRRRRAR